MAVYFGEVPKVGLGIFSRELTPEEMGVLETRRALAVRFIRDGSPAYVSDIFPGDIITQIDGKPFDKPALDAAFATGKPFPIKVYRNGQYKDIIVTTPENWR